MRYLYLVCFMLSSVNVLAITDLCVKDKKIIVKSSDRDDDNVGPYFEFCINGEVITALTPIWKLVQLDTLMLSNGGTQLSYTVEATGKNEGLVVVIDRQFFTDSNIVRERLRLRTRCRDKFLFRNHNGGNHFIFPRYSFNIDGGDIQVQEMRMGSYGLEVLEDFNPLLTYDDRPFRNLAGCHMFHVDYIDYNLSSNILSLKGPFVLVEMEDYKILTTYEHASQDFTYVKSNKNTVELLQIDDKQGVEGDDIYLPTDDDFWFIGSNVCLKKNLLLTSQNIRHGGYCDGEAVPFDFYWETVWSTICVAPKQQDHFEIIRDYLLYKIGGRLQNKNMRFYYNTWGLQRDSKNENMGLREIFNEKRILEEIDYAAELNVDIFVFDDGWQKKHGYWKPDLQKLPNGLQPLIDKVYDKGMIPGVWLSLVGIDSTTNRYKEHPEWVIRLPNGRPVSGQWGHPVFDIVSDFYDMLLEDHKWLIDQGIRYFKWDAINTFNSEQPGLFHGSSAATSKERRDRYNYLVPFYVVRLMRELHEYCPDVVIEIDLTEPERTLVGLMPLQEGKFFWMNNGASSYGDYSVFRTKSMRRIINQTRNLLPSDIFTYAVYPHNISPYFAQRYNVNTSLVGGHGFWGNLRRMSSEERKKIGKTVLKAKRILAHTDKSPMSVVGEIGASPELYIRKNVDKGYAMIIGFSGSALEYPYLCEMDNNKILGVLNHAYRVSKKGVSFVFQFAMPDDTREAFVIGNNDTEISIISSTGWLDDVLLDSGTLKIKAGSHSFVEVIIPYSSVIINNARLIKNKGNLFLIEIQPSETCVISWK